jgi:lambda family phage tail tape measure protein
MDLNAVSARLIVAIETRNAEDVKKVLQEIAITGRKVGEEFTAVEKKSKRVGDEFTTTSKAALSLEKALAAAAKQQQLLHDIATKTSAAVASQEKNLWSLTGVAQKGTRELEKLAAAQSKLTAAHAAGRLGAAAVTDATNKATTAQIQNNAAMQYLSGTARKTTAEINALAAAQSKLTAAQAAGRLGVSAGMGTVGTKTTQQAVALNSQNSGGIYGSPNYGTIGPPSMKGPVNIGYGTGGGQNGPFTFGFPTASQVGITEKANAEYEKLYGNTAKVAQAHRDASSAVATHNGSWIHHLATVAGGIVIYQALREAILILPSQLIGFGIQAVQDYQDNLLGLAATWTTLSKDQSNIPETFKNAVAYAKELIPVMMEIDRSSFMDFDQLMKMNQAFALRGVVINKNNQDQIQGFTNTSNALFLQSKGLATNRQISQEIKALMNGQTRDSDELGKLLKSVIGPEYKKQIADWIRIGQLQGDSGYVVGELGKKLTGFTAAMGMMQGSWSAVTSSIKSTFNLIAIDAMGPVLKDWGKSLNQLNEYLRTHKKEISQGFVDAWEKVKAVMGFVKDHLGWIKTYLEYLVVSKTIIWIIQLVGEFGKLLKVLRDVEIVLTTGAIATTLFSSTKLMSVAKGVASIVREFTIFEALLGGSTMVKAGIALAGFAAGWVALGVAIYYAVDALVAWATQQGKINGPSKATNFATKTYTIGGKTFTSAVNANGSPNISAFKTPGGFNVVKAPATSAATQPDLKSQQDLTDKATAAAAKTTEKRIDLLTKWNSEANKELSTIFMLNDARGVAQKLMEYDIQLKYKHMSKLTDAERFTLERKLSEIVVYKKVQSVMQSMYDEANKGEVAFALAQAALAELQKEGSGNKLTTEQAAEAINKFTREHEKSLNPLYAEQQALKDEAAALGLTADEAARVTYQISLLNKLREQGLYSDKSGFINAETEAVFRQTLAMKENNQVLKDNVPMWTQMQEGVKSWGNDFATTLNDVLYGSQITFKSVAQSFLKMITQIIIQTQIVKPFLSMIGLSSGGVVSAGQLVPSAMGNVFMGGSVVPFATGGIVTKPTFFPMANGAGLMGEAGPEAVMPLTRIGGSLGVKAQTSVPNITVNIVNNTGQPIKKETKTEFNGKEYIITTVLQAVANNENGAKDGLKQMLTS